MSDTALTVLTTGRLDGLVISPCVDPGGVVTHLHFTVKDLPGLRLILEAEAALELLGALTITLGVNSCP